MTSVKVGQARPAGLSVLASGPPGPARLLLPGGRHILLPPVAAAVQPARAFTAAVLSEWGLDALIPDAVLIASELAGNAVRHGCPGPAAPVDLAWACQPGELLCVVTDWSAEPPVQAEPDLGSEAGRGLQIVAAFADAWGWSLLGPDRKAVWATVGIPPVR